MNTGTGVPEARITSSTSLKNLPAGIEFLQLLVEGILAMLGDQQNAVDGELAGAQGEGVGNRGAQTDVFRRGVSPAQIGRRRRLAR